LTGAVLTRDRREEAWAIVNRLHGGAVSDPHGLQYAREEFFQMTEQVRVDGAAWKKGGWRGMLTKKSYQKRFWMGFFIQYAAQSTGAQVIYGMWHHSKLALNSRSPSSQCTLFRCTRVSVLPAGFR
jgi:hypothetical protein